ncbi:MAG: hypothetical protein K2X01_02940 [Cyanobacteria bacterium]|nr:hypothetical protein [Cyanobacteriota bacterium]
MMLSNFNYNNNIGFGFNYGQNSGYFNSSLNFGGGSGGYGLSGFNLNQNVNFQPYNNGFNLSQNIGFNSLPNYSSSFGGFGGIGGGLNNYGTFNNYGNLNINNWFGGYQQQQPQYIPYPVAQPFPVPVPQPIYIPGYPPQLPQVPPPPPLLDAPVVDAPPTVVAQTWGDPHFVGFQGGNYDVMGEVGKTYNILSDQKFQVNATFNPYQGQKDATIISDMGFRVAGANGKENRVQISLGGKITIDGRSLNDGETVQLADGGSVTRKGKTTTVNSKEYKVEVSDAGDHLNTKYSVNKDGVLSDGVLAHGLLGQTADMDGKANNGKQGKGAQGEGAIEGTYKDYEVKGLFDTNDKFNRFGTAQQYKVKLGVGAGKGGGAD